MLVRVCFGLCLAAFLTACDSEKNQEIEWQLPLSVPDDPHSASVGNELPDWAAEIKGTSKIVFLKKSTARLYTVKIESGSSKQLDKWTVELLGLATGLRIKGHAFVNDDKVSNPAVFIRLSLDDNIIYEGWLYQNFPELFGMDNQDWKVWVEDVTMRPSSQEDGNIMLP